MSADSGSPSVTIVNEQPMPTSAYAWALAAYPIWAFILNALGWLATENTTADQDSFQTVLTVAGFAVVLILVYLDDRVLRASGRWSMWGWIFLSPLAYLISREVRLGGSTGPMLLAIATYGLWLTLGIGLLIAT